MNVTAKIALHLIPESLKSQPIFICIDDTMVSKFGLKFENVSKLFDHAAHDNSNYLNGHCFVSLMLCIPVWNHDKRLYFVFITKTMTQIKTKMTDNINIIRLIFLRQTIPWNAWDRGTNLVMSNWESRLHGIYAYFLLLNSYYIIQLHAQYISFLFLNASVPPSIILTMSLCVSSESIVPHFNLIDSSSLCCTVITLSASPRTGIFALCVANIHWNNGKIQCCWFPWWFFGRIPGNGWLSGI